MRVLPPGRKESCCRGEEKEREPPYKRERARAALRGKEREPPYKRERARAALQDGKSESRPTRERAREYGTHGEAYARECMCGIAGGQRRDRSDRAYEMTTEERKERIIDFGGREMWCNVLSRAVCVGKGDVLYCHVRCA